MIMGKIFSINYSKLKGVPKTQVRTAVLVKNHGIKDDAHAGTALRQVSLLPMESVRGQIETARIRNAAVEIRPGIYAENITTEGIDLAALKIGDKLRAGRTAVLQISKIGKECHKHCAIYHQVGDCIMPREGIFAEVLEGGEIAVGDPIRVADGKDEDRNQSMNGSINIAVLTSSDRCARGETADESGKLISDMVKTIGGRTAAYDIVPDEIPAIKDKLLHYCDVLKVSVVITTGGTGFSGRDVTPEATGAVIEKVIPGLPELMRAEGLKKTKKAALSRGICGIRKDTIIINLPGSPKAVKESLGAILDLIPHSLEMLKGGRH